MKFRSLKRRVIRGLVGGLSLTLMSSCGSMPNASFGQVLGGLALGAQMVGPQYGAQLSPVTMMSAASLAAGGGSKPSGFPGSPSGGRSSGTAASSGGMNHEGTLDQSGLADMKKQLRAYGDGMAYDVQFNFGEASKGWTTLHGVPRDTALSAIKRGSMITAASVEKYNGLIRRPYRPYVGMKLDVKTHGSHLPYRNVTQP